MLNSPLVRDQRVFDSGILDQSERFIFDIFALDQSESSISNRHFGFLEDFVDKPKFFLFDRGFEGESYRRITLKFG